MNREIKTVPRRNGKTTKGAKPTFVIYDEIDTFVDNHPNMRFNGWDVEVLRMNPMAWSKPNGVIVDGKWYTKATVSPNSRGQWVFDPKDTYVSAR
jgi:hypothetical protein